MLIACSGSANNFNLEDFYGAAADLSDAARAALVLYRGAALPKALLECRVGRMMAKRGLGPEVEFACREDACPVVPALEGGRLRLVPSGRVVSDSARSRKS